MDNFTLAKIAQNCCATSRAKFSGVWSADNFGLLHCSPPQSRKKTIRTQKKFNSDASKLLVQSYFIVNTSRAGGLGKHWLLLLLLCEEQQPPVHREKQNLMFCVWDPLGKPIKSYPSFFNLLQEVSKQLKIQKVRELQIPLQSPHSNTCGLFCFYVAHYLIRKLEQQSVSLSCLESFILSVFQPLKNLLDIDLVLFCNDHCQTKLLYKII